MLSGLLIGLVFGALFGAMGYAATRGRRDFTSTSKIVAGRYDVMCNPAHAEEARAHPGPLLAPRLNGSCSAQRRVAKAIAAAAATPRESTPGAHRDPRPHPGRLLRLGGEPRPLRAEQHRRPRVRRRVDVAQVDGVGGGGQRHRRVAGVVQPVRGPPGQSGRTANGSVRTCPIETRTERR